MQAEQAQHIAHPPRIRFDASRYAKDLVQAGTPFIRRRNGGGGGQAGPLSSTREERSMSLADASMLIYEHLTERSKTDQPLYDDIVQAGLGEPLAQRRMKAVIDMLLIEYRIHVDAGTLIPSLTPTESIFAETCGAGLIEDLYRLPDVEEVQVIGHHIYLLKGGQMERHERVFASCEAVLRLQDRLALCGKKPINERHPFVQSYMWNRSRLVMTRPPYSDVPSIHIRNFIVKDVTLEQLVELGTLNTRMAQLLRLLVRHHASILIGGGTATGKTTFLFALANEIPEHERIRTLEKEFEVALRERLRGTRNILAVREVEDMKLTMEEAFKPLLVMSPHWVIVGEAKGAEVSQMVQGALRGHDMMGTMHTKYRESFISDVVDMIKQDGRHHDTADTICRVARAFNIIVFLRIVQVDGKPRRIVTEITELYVDREGAVQIKPLVEWSYMKQCWQFTEHRFSHSLTGHLLANGAQAADFEELGVWERCREL
ncbi:ATPase, T2SS/T4P/T4SS family [Paenibacillus sp. YYML68]|uniref:ATPase, T2SS/T4P/T4SS family n=1 Tax=Paenibacillus sp. YYML68 TaxID=2909250 RepID=UPI002490DE32|nr:ATPase, T2SS/T4P/T4SS family [Paenibacillus sp. YYML68]